MGLPLQQLQLGSVTRDGPIIGSLAQTSLGLTVYAWVDSEFYLELGGYTSPAAVTLTRLGVDPTAPGNIHGVAPYGRLAFVKNWGQTPVAGALTDSQMTAVAAYFSRQRAYGGLQRRWEVPDDWAATLATRGDPTRNLPPCAACHEPGAGGPVESPQLWGQHQEYLVAQLQAFAEGTRRNDIFGRMRAVADKLTPSERARLAEYYQGLR